MLTDFTVFVGLRKTGEGPFARPQVRSDDWCFAQVLRIPQAHNECTVHFIMSAKLFDSLFLDWTQAVIGTRGLKNTMAVIKFMEASDQADTATSGDED